MFSRIRSVLVILNMCIAGISDALRRRSGSAAGPSDWRQLGVPEWLADRAEQLGFRFPTGGDTEACQVKRDLIHGNTAKKDGAAPRVARR